MTITTTPTIMIMLVTILILIIMLITIVKVIIILTILAVLIGVWWGYPLGPNGKYSVRGERVCESEREGKREGTSAD